MANRALEPDVAALDALFEERENRRQELLREVAWRDINKVVENPETGRLEYWYDLGGGEYVKFWSFEIYAARQRLSKERAEQEKAAKTAPVYDELTDVAQKNDCIRIKGHSRSDYSVGTWVRSDGKLAKYTLGEVRIRRIELGLEEENINE